MSEDKATPVSTATPVDTLGDDNAAQLNAWCAEVLTLRAVAKSFDAQADTIFDDKVKPLLEQLGVNNSVSGPTFTIVRSKGRDVLKAELLLQHGVSMAVIEKSKVTGKPSWGLRSRDDKSVEEQR